MANNDLSQFHELAEQFRGEIPLKELCVQEGVRYHTYLRWRNHMGIPPRITRKSVEAPVGMIEIEAEKTYEVEIRPPKATSVHIVFENGLTFDRQDMEVDSLVEFLTKIRAALCLG